MVSRFLPASVLLGSTLTSILAAPHEKAVHARQEEPDFSSFHYEGSPLEPEFAPIYDFCVVGGGTAGMVLANRLTESGKHRVVVFEAGGPPTVVGSYLTPGGNQYVLNGEWSPIDYNFQTVPQTHMNNRTFAYHRGRTMGGSSSTNGLYYGLGSKAVYDQWEKDGNPGWNWETLQKMAKKATTFVGNPEHTNDDTYMTWDPENYGDGPLKIGFQGRVVSSNPSFMKALEAINIPVVKDQNGGSPVGVKQGTMTLDENFMRSSSYDSYYMQAKDRENLDVLNRAIVSRIIFDEKPNGHADESAQGPHQPRATGVTYVNNYSGVFHNVTCSKEVILAGGAFHSPYLLMVSGIGPKDLLEEYDIEPLVVNDNVGQNMKDHTAFSVIHEIKQECASEASTSDMINDLTVLNREQKNFWKGGKDRWLSKWSAPSGCTNGFQEISNEALESFGAGDIVEAGLIDQAQNEILYESIAYPAGPNGYYTPLQNKSYISVTVSNLAALSLGSVLLGSNRGTDSPVINPNYLEAEADQKMAIQGVKYLRQVMEHPEMQRWSAGEVSPGKSITSDDDLLEYAKNTMVPNWHASGTCVMLPKDKKGVVDSHLRVYDTKSLRVIDVSTMGRLPDVNLVGPVYMVAEMGAEIVRKDWNDV